MTIDLDARWPHDDGCDTRPPVYQPCSCDRDARIAAHIERLEGALREIAKGDWSLSTDFRGGDNQMTSCAGCGVQMWNQHGFTSYVHGDDCTAPKTAALMAELGEAP
jgi:hypothetical protein